MWDAFVPNAAEDSDACVLKLIHANQLLRPSQPDDAEAVEAGSAGTSGSDQLVCHADTFPAGARSMSMSPGVFLAAGYLKKSYLDSSGG